MPEKKLRGYIELFWEFFKLGAFTIGGGIAMVPLVSDIAVRRKEWLSDEEMIDCISLCQSLPGVIAINMATYIGFKLKKTAGAAAATVGVVLPSFCIIIVVVRVLQGIGDNVYVTGALTGLKAAATGMIAYAAFGISAKVIKNVFAAVISIAAFVSTVCLNINVVYVIAAGILIGAARSVIKEDAGKDGAGRDGTDGKGGCDDIS